MASAFDGFGRLAAVLLCLATLGACARDPSVLGSKMSLANLPFRPVAEGRTDLVAFETSPFPFHGTPPGAARAFMDVNDNGRLGHSSARNGVLWEDQTYSDQRVLLSIPPGFDPRRPSALVVFLHGNEATLQRDVIDRQGVVRQLEASGINAVLVAPQLAYDARDSSAGRFWEPGVFNQFLHEAARRIADLYGTRDAEFVFDRAPVILAGYSGGYLPAAAALRYGRAGSRIHGVILLDALYGEEETYESFIASRGDHFFVSVYGKSSKEGNLGVMRLLSDRGIAVETALGASIGPGSVAFVDAGEAVAHGDFVTQALNGDPLADILSRIRAFPRRPGSGLVASEAELIR